MKKVSILIVEDELELQKKLSQYMKIFCETIYLANNGKEALNIYNEFKPDIILTDINMPVMNGIEFIKKVRHLDKNTQIIILSAHTNVDYLLESIELNLVKYLVKPIDMYELKKVITSSIGQISQNEYIALNNNYFWNPKIKSLVYENKVIELTSYELSLLSCLIDKKNIAVSYEDIHYYIYGQEEYSLNAISSLVKRIRQKSIKNFITSSYKFGYKIDS
ncbi:MAG: response regulator [Sulfurimonas sp.]|nr:response regulator [Sulfurimonas sp.]